MSRTFEKDLMGKIALAVYRHHASSSVTYEFGDNAQKYFDNIVDNLASQFNSHYNLDDELTDSQPLLSSQQRAEIDVRTKAGELIGRLSAVLWIYRNGMLLTTEYVYIQISHSFNTNSMLILLSAFMCIANGKPFHIPLKIDVQCVKSAESIVNSSYSHAEVFTSVS